MSRNTLLVSVLLIGLSWAFWSSPFLFPVRVFVVLLHEVGHGVAAVLTGGSLVRIELSIMEGGLAYTEGGNRLVVLNAGYLGSLLFGVLLLLSARRPSVASLTLIVVALSTAVLTALYLRPVFGFSFLYGIGASLVLSALAARAPASAHSFILRFLGIFSCLYALFDIRDDILTFDRSRGVSDAVMLEQLTLIPSFVWGVLWLGLSGFILFKLRRPLLGT